MICSRVELATIVVDIELSQQRPVLVALVRVYFGLQDEGFRRTATVQGLEIINGR
jgi:hypothetical protein